jgi:hypothetical protein
VTVRPQGGRSAGRNFSFGETTMGLAQYSIVPLEASWSVLHDGTLEGHFETKEAAFEAAVMAASLAMREGHEVHVSVPAREVATGTTSGIPATG